MDGLPTDRSSGTVTATGTGRVRVAPDVVDIRLGVAVTRPTAAAALAQAAAAMAAVLAALRGAGVADRDLQTAGLALEPVLEHRPDGPPRLHGYEVRNGVAARLRDVARLAEAVDGAVAAGATSLDGVAFDRTDRAAAEAAARAAAVEDALTRVRGLAAAAGTRLGRVVAIVEGPGSRPSPYPVPVFRALAAEAFAPATPVEAGETEVAVTVEVVVALDQDGATTR